MESGRPASSRGLVDAVDDPSDDHGDRQHGDDCEMHGLSISPDLDTVTYTLAGAIDPDRGWGLVDESWRAMESLGTVRSGQARPARAPRPAGSTSAIATSPPTCTAPPAWRRAPRLTDVTDEIRRAWNVPISIVPMTDDRIATTRHTVEHGEISFQDYFVRLHHDVAVTAVHFRGDARLSPVARRALEHADVVVIAPSNPLVSIGPIRSPRPTSTSILAARRDRVVAVSPIVGGAALKGPADHMMVELGHEASVVGVARLYAPIASALVIDEVDAHLADAVEAAGMRCVVRRRRSCRRPPGHERSRPTTLAAVS